MVNIDYIDLLDKEFENNASGPDKYDCYYLAKEIFRRAGKNLPLFTYSSSIEERNDLIESNIDKITDKIDGPESLGIVVLQIHPKYTSHFGVLLDNYRFIHIMKDRGVKVERLDSPYWCKKIRGYRRLKDKVDG